MAEKTQQEKLQEKSAKFEDPFQIIRKDQTKSRRLLKAIREKDSTYKYYEWDPKENYAYIAYLINFRQILDSHQERKRIKVFNHLAKLIKTRSSHQIKSHHQKMMLRHQSVDGIIRFLQQKITNEIQKDPNLVTVIRETNQEVKIFTEEEVTKVHLGSNSQTPFQYGVKVEEVGQPKVGYPEVKVEEPEHGLMLTLDIKPCLKLEEVENIIWQKND